MEEKGPQEEELQEEVEKEAGDKDDETLEVLRKEQVLLREGVSLNSKCRLAIDLCLDADQVLEWSRVVLILQKPFCRLKSWTSSIKLKSE